MFDVFFKAVPANEALAANATIYESWMQGGYYAADLSDEVMVISINGMYPFSWNH